MASHALQCGLLGSSLLWQDLCHSQIERIYVLLFIGFKLLWEAVNPAFSVILPVNELCHKDMHECLIWQKECPCCSSILLAHNDLVYSGHHSPIISQCMLYMNIVCGKVLDKGNGLWMILALSISSWWQWHIIADPWIAQSILVLVPMTFILICSLLWRLCWYHLDWYQLLMDMPQQCMLLLGLLWQASCWSLFCNIWTFRER